MGVRTSSVSIDPITRVGRGGCGTISNLIQIDCGIIGEGGCGNRNLSNGPIPRGWINLNFIQTENSVKNVKILNVSVCIGRHIIITRSECAITRYNRIIRPNDDYVIGLTRVEPVPVIVTVSSGQ